MRNLKVGILFIIGSIILGAFAAHTLKEFFSPERLESFKTGVSYLMYNGLGLLALESLKHNFKSKGFKYGSLMVILGTCFFSISIFLLCWFSQIGLNSIKPVLGPITPIGGLLMIIGWSVLFVNINHTKCRKNT